ncbi:MAG: biopolymer transporter ExbD, partial [Planctomycetaceae bacterium]|nr:biopolymer transporter ExbD [Planctomycetaceae bacterium]
MPLKTQQPEEPALNLTPMIDIVLLLVIFFMVGTQFTEAERQYQIDLPAVSVAQPLTALPDEIVVNVAKDGSVQVKK